MRQLWRLGAAFVSGAVLSLPIQGQAPVAVDAILGATVIDATGAPPMPDTVILIGNRRLTCVGTRSSCPVPRAARTLDARGLWAIPGLIDVHVHIAASDTNADPRVLLAAGITAARDVGAAAPDTGTYATGRGQIERIAEIARDIERERVPGPWLTYCGPGFTTGDRATWPPHPNFIRIPSAETNVAAVVEYLVDRGASCLKLFSGLQPPQMRALLREGHARDLPVIGHPDPTPPLSEQLALGWAEMHHTNYVRPEDLLSPDRRALLPADGEAARTVALWALFDPTRTEVRDLARAVARTGTAWVPALAIGERERPAGAYEWHWDGLAAASAASDAALLIGGLLAGAPVPATTAERDTVMRRAQWRFRAGWTQALREAQVPILAGSDASAGFPLGAGLHAELESLVRAGLTPLEAIRSATAVPAERLAMTAAPPERAHWARLGTLTLGKSADVVLLKADPLVDISNVRRIQLVVRDGIVYGPEALRVRLPSAPR